MEIDVAFDVRSDSNGGDPDSASLKLKKYHQILWSKPLPNGQNLELLDSKPESYLSAEVMGKKFTLRSDSIANSYASSNAKVIKQVVSKIDSQIVEDFLRINCTIGGYIIFPGNKVDGKMTINGARGFNKLIADRFDLTLECIRRLYNSQESPLSATFNRYSDFFELFDNFEGYLDFFLLRDLVNQDGSINYFTEIKDPFTTSPYPKSVDEYLEYKETVTRFVLFRNQRIKNYCESYDLKFSELYWFM